MLLDLIVVKPWMDFIVIIGLSRWGSIALRAVKIPIVKDGVVDFCPFVWRCSELVHLSHFFSIKLQFHYCVIMYSRIINIDTTLEIQVNDRHAHFD